MKKIALLLAFILCLVPVLSACSIGGGGGVKAVKKYLDALYVDFDAEALSKVYVLCNEELMEEILDSDEFEDYEKVDYIDEIEEELEEAAEVIEKAKKYDFDYEIYDSRNIKEDDDEFDAIIENVGFKDNGFEDVIQEFCIVRVVGLFTFVNDDKEERVQEFYKTILTAKIDGKWYVITEWEFDTAYESDDEDASLKEWL